MRFFVFINVFSVYFIMKHYSKVPIFLQDRDDEFDIMTNLYRINVYNSFYYE